MVVNLQLTHKDPVQSKIDKARRTTHPHEVRHHFPTVTLHPIIRTVLENVLDITFISHLLILIVSSERLLTVGSYSQTRG
jgi:hypothetical protein